MKPIHFPGSNTTFGANQPEYSPLPALVPGDGTVITCWEPTPEEIDDIVKHKKIYLKQLTFGAALQPIMMTTDLSDGIALIPDNNEA